MFSGIIEHTAKILSVESGVFRVENTFQESLKEGQSIAHDGACMTLTKITPEYYEFFTMQESLSVTNFGSKGIGDSFNVERSLKLSDRLDGHIVTGHIDTVGKVILFQQQQDKSLILGISYSSQYNNLVIKKGSIAINGVSLTIVSVDDGSLIVSLIPITQDWTNLGYLKIGDSVNLEFDLFGKFVHKNLESYK